MKADSKQLDEKKKKELRDKIIIGAKLYKKKLINKIFYIICDDGTTNTVIFTAKDFVHLTGVKSNLDSGRFFENSSKAQLSVGNILTEQKYNWNTLKHKVRHIECIDGIVYTNKKSVLYLEELVTNTFIYPVVINNIDDNMCVGFKDDKHYARTLRKSANSMIASKMKKIICILAKRNTEEKYSECTYLETLDKLVLVCPDILKEVSKELELKIKL